MSVVFQARSLGKFFYLFDNGIGIPGFLVVFALISIRFVGPHGVLLPGLVNSLILAVGYWQFYLRLVESAMRSENPDLRFDFIPHLHHTQ